jgi:hypothetical protein
LPDAALIDASLALILSARGRFDVDSIVFAFATAGQSRSE